MSRIGLEPSGVSTESDEGLQDEPRRGGALSGAEKAISGDFDPKLQRVIDAWPTLPDPRLGNTVGPQDGFGPYRGRSESPAPELRG